MLAEPRHKFPRRIYLSVPHMGGKELEMVRRAFEQNWLSTVGPNLTELEDRFGRLVGRPAVAVSSGTSALHLALRLVGVGPGDEVVGPTLTFVASCNPIRYQGGIPVLIDSERVSWNIDPVLLCEFLRGRAKRNRLPKTVIVVHLFGQSADLNPILEVCREFDVSVVEDAAECLGARYYGQHPGTLGDVGVYSFNGNKVITATSGGMLVSARADWVKKARFWSTQARDEDPDGIRNYIHSEIGYNYRLSNVLAGIALGQLDVLEERVRQRRKVAFTYKEAFLDLPGIELMPEAPGRFHSYWLSCFLIDEEEFGMSAADLIRFLEAANVEARPVWKPMHLQPLYSSCERVGGEVAEDLNRRGICLPSSSSLSEEEQQFVIDCVREAHRAATVKRSSVGARVVSERTAE